MSEPESRIVKSLFDMEQNSTDDMTLKCPLCLNTFREPKVLACFHSFCKPCLEHQMEDGVIDKIKCPICNIVTQLTPALGISSLLSDYGLENILLRQQTPVVQAAFALGSPGSGSQTSLDLGFDQNSNPKSLCTGCKVDERANGFCQNCSHFLCNSCIKAHKIMHCFENHKVDMLSPDSSSSSSVTSQESQCTCIQHNSRPLRFFCLTCDAAICVDCAQIEHAAPIHHYELLSDVAEKQVKIIETLLQDARKKLTDLKKSFKDDEAMQDEVIDSTAQMHEALDESIRSLHAIVEDVHQQAVKEVDEARREKQLQLAVVNKKVQQITEKFSLAVEFTDRLVNSASPEQVMVFKQLLQNRLLTFLSFNPNQKDAFAADCNLEVRPLDISKAREQIKSLIAPVRRSFTSGGLSSAESGLPVTPIGHHRGRQLFRSHTGVAVAKSVNYSDSNLLRLKQEFGSSSQCTATMPKSVANIPKQYGNWSSGIDPSSCLFLSEAAEMEESGFKASAVSQHISRQKMIYHCKFGEFGVMEGQFTEPSGVAVNIQNDIVVADTNNHRIQVFSKDGRFKFQFGECGKRDGQMLYPNRVAVNRLTGDFIVTERSPTHQIQVYNQFGQFVRKFGATVLQHPRGVCVDSNGLIIVVECKIMRVIMFDITGQMVRKFSCSRFLEFPNGICTSDVPEIYISDNRAHAIKVFSYEGQFLRQIGGEGITNYPIGVGINSCGQVVVGDNHNNFNITVFSQDGAVIAALESKVKHAQCFDMALIDDGSVVLASKDYRIYIYRYRSPTA